MTDMVIDTREALYYQASKYNRKLGDLMASARKLIEGQLTPKDSNTVKRWMTYAANAIQSITFADSLRAQTTAYNVIVRDYNSMVANVRPRNVETQREQDTASKSGSGSMATTDVSMSIDGVSSVEGQDVEESINRKHNMLSMGAAILVIGVVGYLMFAK